MRKEFKGFSKRGEYNLKYRRKAEEIMKDLNSRKGEN